MRISPRNAVYGKERVQTSPRGDIQPDVLSELDDLINLYNAKLAECTALIIEFETALNKLREKERRLMRYYYIDCMTWEQVCVTMGISWTSHHRLKTKAYAKIAKA